MARVSSAFEPPYVVDPEVAARAYADDDPEETAFLRRWGPWAHLSPREAAAFLAGFDRPWWVSGGWAIEAFTGVRRRHEDVDVTIFRSDVPALLAHAGERFHLWAAGSRTLRPLEPGTAELPEWADQVWVREHALAPWLFDVVTNRGDASAWEFKREPSYVRPLAEVTWVAADGVRYLRPELVLAHKVALGRPKDLRDAAVAEPLLDAPARAWLEDFRARAAERAPGGDGDG